MSTIYESRLECGKIKSTIDDNLASLHEALISVLILQGKDNYHNTNKIECDILDIKTKITELILDNCFEPMQ